MIVIYPRGFIGVGSNPAEREGSGEDLQTILTNIKLNLPIGKEDEPYKANAAVEDLYQSYRLGNFTEKDPVFSEKVLLTCMRAYGATSFGDWCRMQQQSPYFTRMHKHFLNDTFRFIETGRREVSVENMGALVDRQPKTIKDDATALEIDAFLNLNRPLEFRRSDRLTDIVTAWLSQRGGFNDFLTSTRTFFGEL